MAQPDAAALLPLAESIADGSPVDWEAIEPHATPEELAIIRQLRILEHLARWHRSLPADAPRRTTSAPTTTGRVAGVSPAIRDWPHVARLEGLAGGRSATSLAPGIAASTWLV